MEPTFTDINVTETLLNQVTHNNQIYSTVTINQLIVRPVLQRIVFTTNEFGRVIVHQEADFSAHSGDTSTSLINDLLNTIDTQYKK